MIKNKKIKIVLIIVAILSLIALSAFLYSYIRIKTAKIEVILVDDLTLEFNDDKKFLII